MFTSVMLDNGEEVQIKTGWDECERFHVGDEVPWHPIKGLAGEGYLFDGVYDGMSCKGLPPKWKDYWVVIADHRIAAVVPAEVDEDGFWSREQRKALEEEHGVKPPDRSLWSEEEWELHDRMREEAKRKADQFMKEGLALAERQGVPPEERAVVALQHAFLMSWMETRPRYTELAEKLFHVEPLPPGAEPVYGGFGDVGESDESPD